MRRLAAVLILRALASRAPTLFYEAHLKQPKGFGLKTPEKPQPAYIWSVITDKEKVNAEAEPFVRRRSEGKFKEEAGVTSCRLFAARPLRPNTRYSCAPSFLCALII